MQPLDAMDQRILGSLLEKQRTVPATYPLTLNALRTACNQQSSRDPVTAYEERELELRCRDLRDRGLVRIVAVGRTLKFHQLLDEELSLQPDERALLTVLLLRGPQAPGELRTRTERLHAFADRGQVEDVLTRMAAAGTPLVRQLPRRPGQQDHRWVHLLGPVPAPESGTEPETPAVDRDAVLAAGADVRDQRVRAAYDTLATAYADHLAAELERKPFDRWLLHRVATEATGPVVDVGTGPGHVAGFLAAAGAEVTGLDLSPGMVEEARRRFPDIAFEVGDLARLMRPRSASGWGAVTAWYALGHLGSSELPAAVEALARVLDPGGLLALAVHLGQEVRHATALWEQEVDLDFVLHDRDQVLTAVSGAGLVDVEWYERGPLEGEVATDRLYVLARKA